MAGPQVQISSYAEGDRIWLPVTEVRKQHPGFNPGHGASVVEGKLAGRVGGDIAPGTPRTWNVDVSGLKVEAGVQLSIPVSSRSFSRYAKVLNPRIGDWETEQPTLNPLAESL